MSFLVSLPGSNPVGNCLGVREKGISPDHTQRSLIRGEYLHNEANRGVSHRVGFCINKLFASMDLWLVLAIKVYYSKPVRDTEGFSLDCSYSMSHFTAFYTVQNPGQVYSKGLRL